MTLEEKDKYIADHLMQLTAETLRFMVADLHAEIADIERNYSHQLGEMARLSDIVCSEVLSYSNTDLFPENVMDAANEIMQYVDAVRPSEDEKETKWAMHIIGPDDVIPCVGEFDALRKANQHNMAFARLAADNISLNDPYCVAVAEQI